MPEKKEKIHKPYSNETVRAISRDKTRMLRHKLALQKELIKFGRRIFFNLWKDVAHFFAQDAKLAKV